MRKKASILFFVVVAIAATAVFALARNPASPPAKITWSAGELAETMFPGTTKTVTVSFQSSRDISDAVVRVTPSLGGIVSTEPAEFPTIVAGQDYELAVTLVAPLSEEPEEFDGTIQLRNAGRPPRTYARPLPVVITTEFLVFQESGFGFEINYPSNWDFRPLPAETTRIGFHPITKPQEPLLEYVGDIILEVIPNPSGLELEPFYRNRASVDLFVNSREFERFEVDGRPAVMFFDVFDMIPTNIVSIQDGQTVIELSDVGQLHETDGVFDQIVRSFTGGQGENPD